MKNPRPHHSNATRSRRFALASLLALAAPSLVLAIPNWGPSGLDGAGTQDCLAIQPGGTGLVVSASDVSGLQVSYDWGVTWLGANVGTPSGGPQKAATVAFTNDPNNPNTVYAGSGQNGSGGGFLKSTDGATTWDMVSTTPQFCAENTGASGLPGYPRSTGNLIAPDENESGTQYLYCGTYNQGAMRSTNHGSSWTTVGLSGDFIRGIALDPSNLGTLYVAVYGGHIWKTTTARTTSGTGTSGWTQLTGAPLNPEEMLFLSDGSLYVVGNTGGSGTAGVWKSTNGGTSWSSIAPSPVPNYWTAIAGYVNGSSDVLYIGASGPGGTSPSCNSLMVSTNSGSSWSNITQSSNVVDQIGGAGGPGWWMAASSGGPGYILGHGSGDVDNIQIDPVYHNIVLTGGRGGVWGTTNGTASPSSIVWYPMVDGLSVAGCYTAATDPNHAGRIYIGDEDWIFFYSTDSGATFQRNAPNSAGGTVCRSIYVDPTNSTTYIGSVNHDNNTSNCDVFSDPNPTDGVAGNWTATNLWKVTGGGNVRGVIAGHNGSSLIMLAAVEGSGIWRYSSGAWQSSAVNTTVKSSVFAQFAWNSGSQYVYVYDQGTGLWMSSNYGSSFSKIWTQTSGSNYSGYLAEDPNDSNTGTLYISVDSGVYRLTNAATGSPTVKLIGGSGIANSPQTPAAMTLANGNLYCASADSTSPLASNSEMCESTNPSASTPTWSVISDSLIYPGQSNWPSDMAVDGSGTVYLSESMEGAMVSAQALLYSDNFSSGEADGWTVYSGAWSVGSGVYTQSNSAGGVSNTGDSSWSKYAVQAQITPTTLGTGSLGLSLYYRDFNDRYFCLLKSGELDIKESIGGTQSLLASTPFTINANTAYTVKFQTDGTTLKLFINGTLEVSTPDPGTYTSGQIGLNLFECTGNYGNVLVEPTD